MRIRQVDSCSTQGKTLFAGSNSLSDMLCQYVKSKTLATVPDDAAESTSASASTVPDDAAKSTVVSQPEKESTKSTVVSQPEKKSTVVVSTPEKESTVVDELEEKARQAALKSKPVNGVNGAQSRFIKKALAETPPAKAVATPVSVEKGKNKTEQKPKLTDEDT